MPTDASGKGSADAASVTASNRLTKTQLDAILNLAAAGDVEPKEEAARLDARGAASPVHIAIWDPVNEVKLSGADAPTTESLADFLKSHPNCEVFAGQKPSGRAATERSGLDKLVDASGSPSTLGDKHLTLREHAAFSQGGEEPTKRSMYTPEQLQRLQVRNATSPCASAPTMFLRAKAFGATACVRTQVLGLPSSLRRRSSRRASCPARSSARYRLGHTPCCTELHRATPTQRTLLCSTPPLLHSTDHAARSAQALAVELDIPTRSVQIWFQNRRQRVKSASHGQKRTGTEKEAASGNEDEDGPPEEKQAGTEKQAADRAKEKKPRRGKAEKSSATSAIDSLAMISSMAAGHSSLSAEAEARPGTGRGYPQGLGVTLT